MQIHGVVKKASWKTSVYNLAFLFVSSIFCKIIEVRDSVQFVLISPALMTMPGTEYSIDKCWVK